MFLRYYYNGVNVMKKEELIEEFDYKLRRLEKDIEDQQQEIWHKINNLQEWEETLKRSIKEYYEMTNEKDKQEYLNKNNYRSINDYLDVYINYFKKLKTEIQKYNDTIHKISIFEISERQVKEEIQHVINRTEQFSRMFNEGYIRLIIESSDFLKNPKEENLENFIKIINTVPAEILINENRNILNNSQEVTSLVRRRAQSSMGNDEIEINIKDENYNPINVFYNQVEQPTNITLNNLGNNRYFNVDNGLKVPKVSLEELMKHSYRAHNMIAGSHYSLNGKAAFTDDEFVYQEFLSYVTFKMKENEPRLTMKLEGLHPTKKREMLQTYLNNVLTEITSNIKINNNQVIVPDYLLESSATQYILRVNGYDMKRNENIKDFLTTSSRASLVRKEPIDEIDFSRTFSENYKPTTLDDANVKKILNDGKGINELDFENAQKTKQRIEGFKKLVIDFLNEENFEKQQQMIDEIDDYRINDLIQSEYKEETIYNRNITFFDQLENFKMLIDNNDKIENLKTKLIRAIYVNYSEKNRNIGSDVKMELCENIIQECDAILNTTQQIIETYEKENKIIKAEKPRKEESVLDSKIENKEKEKIKKEENIDREIAKSEEQNKIKNIELEKEINELEEMMKEVVLFAPSSIRNSWFDFARKNYNVLASKCTQDDYAKILETYFEKAEDIVTKSSKITEEDLKTLGIYYGLRRIDKSQVGKNVVEENNAEKVIEMLENYTKKSNVQQK